MADRGAPEGNGYAKKADTGRVMSVYLRAEDMALLRLVLEQRGEASSDAECIALAKIAAKAGINRLLIDKREEVMHWAEKSTSV